MGVAHVGLVYRDSCRCKVKGFRVVSSIEMNVSKSTCKGCVIQHLEIEFVMDYCKGDRAMYLSIYNDDDKVLDVSYDIVTS